MMQQRIKCDVCILSIHNAFLLLKLKKWLIKPSQDLLSILMRTERYIKHTLLMTDKKLPADTNFYNAFCHKLAINIFSENIYFQTLDNHVFDCSLFEESHVMRLIRTAILCNTKIRLHHVVKKQGSWASCPKNFN
ncbi:hypothetical protein RN001_010534 [Aquatica leii]|uniref:Uncharacterized protein n=1 Tax=Aquatica leii TaxID=1421715 RepID=A0AAN7QHI9_9COLE|nr:hypothetical protein RN001_010534 [Aquatica leii]